MLRLTIFLFVFAMFTSCKSDTETADVMTSDTQFAELLQRSEKIQLGKEWDAVQNQFSDYKTAIKKNPKDYLSQIGLAELYIREARVTGEHGHYYNAALDIVNDVLTKENLSDEEKFNALKTKAGVQLSLHKFPEALVSGKAAIDINNRNAQIYGVLVDCYVELGQYDKAVETADKMVSLKPDIRSYSRVSYIRELYGDIDGAKEAMTMAVKSGFPGYEETAWATLTLGNLYAEYGDLDYAEQVYTSILESREDYPFAIAALGDIALERKEYDKAEKLLNEAIAIIPEVGYYMSMARLYKEEDRNEEFEKTMDEIFVMLKEDEDSGHVMNLAYVDLYTHLIPDNEKAMSYLMREYNERPENIEINRLMAELSIAMDDNAKAKEYIVAAEATNSKHPDLLALKKNI